LFPVAESKLVVVMFAVFTKVVQEADVVLSVPVITNVPPLPAGSVHSENVLTGIVIPAGTRSEIVTLFAGFPQLFP